MDNTTNALEEDKEQLSSHYAVLELLELKYEDLDNRSRRSNLHIHGLPEYITSLKDTAMNLYTVLYFKWTPLCYISGSIEHWVSHTTQTSPVAS